MTSPDPEITNLAEGVLEEEGQKILSGFHDIELDVGAVDVLFHANPRVLTAAQRAVVIESIRRHRAERTEKKKARAAKKPKDPEAAAKLTLDDLGTVDIDT